MTNIRDLAKMAGVSVSTVSRVLNHHPYVKEEKRKAVLEAIQKSNYQQNINAVHLSKGKTFLIGVVLPFSDHPYFAQLVNGIASEAIKQNYKLVLIQTNYVMDREMEALQMLKQKQIDALIICSRICDWPIFEEYKTYGPIVFCEDTKGKAVSSTFIDHYKSFTYALEYLYRKGHQKIGYCVVRKSGSSSHYRGMAYRDFIDKYQLAYREEYVFYHCLYFEDGEQVINQIKQMDNPPSALLVTNDQVAAGIVTCAHQQNISIPEKLAIIGFDDQPIAKMMNITTIEIPLVEMGRKLFNQAMKTDQITHEEVSIKLIERRTV